MDSALDGKVALVTGGGVRLGRALALALGHAGATVAVHAHRSVKGAQEVVQALQAAGRTARSFEADLTLDRGPETLAEEVEKALGPVSILVNSAGRFDRVPFLETPASVLDQTWQLNARAPFLLTQAVAKGMVARGQGDVINVLDIGGTFAAWQEYAAYCMSKAALAMLTQVLSLELAPAVRVNGVAPGAVLPPENMTPAQLEVLKARIPAGRFGSPEDVAQSVLFLLTGPSFITGQILAVDGGRMRGLARGERLGNTPKD